MKKANLVLAAICAALGIYVIVVASGYPTAEAYGTGAPGPGLWPICIAAVLLLCTVILVVRTLRTKAEDDTPIVVWGDGPIRVYISMAILIAYAIILPIVGFLVPTFVMMTFFIQWFSRDKLVKSALLALIVTMVVYCTFRYFLNVPIHFGLIAF